MAVMPAKFVFMKKGLIYCLGIVLLLGACQQNEKMYNLSEKESDEVNASQMEGETNVHKKSALTENLKLIKNGELSFQVNDIDKASSKIRELTAELNGYISKDYTTANERSSFSVIEIRLPNENFDSFMNYAQKNANGEVERKVEVKDVTKEYVDFELRLNAAKKAQERYLELLKKANKVEEMLQVEQKLQQVLAEIESIEGQIRFYNDKISLSTITVEMRTKDDVVAQDNAEKGFWFDLKNAFKRGWNLILGLIVALTHLWVLIPFIALGIYWYKKKKA